MEIKDNMEHLSLSQSKSNMKQFNKQLQAVPCKMMELLGQRAHAGRLQTARCGFVTTASCWCLATVLWWKTIALQNQSNGPVEGYLGGLPSWNLSHQDMMQVAGWGPGGVLSRVFMFCLLWSVCVFSFYLIHMPTGKKIYKALEICKNSKLVAFPFYI